ncbi:glycosyltransferase family 1 protein [Sphingomonas gilva]|uniref:Glycosyltransferase family 1 protein n=1 Tax=Sphingomonas gilva TaxID=2305907 RepID=A0A396S0U7_9SPHN|nr:glycosyltransferase family 1 protein [Sphingomonas gilva]RHW16985.1 glycosyltransferase family 1 protein [Sphingomonas gilva]
MKVTDLRIALFSGNYNYTRDGANQALNRLVAYLLAQGAAVRIYSPTVEHPAFPATGDLVDVPAVPMPFGRGEYRFAMGLPAKVRADLRKFAPNMVHVSAPELLGHRAVTYARRHHLPVVASVHTRFETYPRYYNLGFMEPLVEKGLKRFYNRCDAIVAPSRSMADLLAEQGMNPHIGIWSRGVDHHIFNPAARSLEWRRSLGIGDDEVAIGFLGRLVLEKGLDVFGEAMQALAARGVPHRVLVIGDGPARETFAAQVPEAVFAGFQRGADLGRAVASMDIFLNPSVTETFGNVTLEAMACAVPVVAADATGSASLVEDGVTGRLVPPRDIAAYADALAHYATDDAARRAAGQAGYDAAKAYGWDAINQKVVDTYLEVIARRSMTDARNPPRSS